MKKEDDLMIDIPKDEKVRVGKAIEFLRKKEFKNVPSFKIERFIENICSKATYVKLRKVPLKESEIYDSLLAKLSLFILTMFDCRRNFLTQKNLRKMRSPTGSRTKKYFWIR